MSVVLVSGSLCREDFEKSREEYESYIKITIDLASEIVALGGEYHADAEKILIDGGSKQEDIWGGGVNLETKQFETNAIVNLRSGRNDGTEILDPQKREKFLLIARKALKDYV